MTILFLLFFFTTILSISSSSSSQINASNTTTLHRRRTLFGSCGTGNPVDDCWRSDPRWADNRRRLADCGIGFGRNAIGGKNGPTYVVTDPSDDDPSSPAPGTLRYGLIQDGPLWIVFAHDMTIRPKHELVVGSHKTVDGRGAQVVVGEGGACFAVDGASNVIIHGVTIRGCRPKPRGPRGRSESDGDGVSVCEARDVWIDRCSFEDCADGLVDVTRASTGVTVSNSLFTNHDKAMLLGHSDSFDDDRAMRVTVTLNRFGPGLVQRMPRYFILCVHCHFIHFLLHNLFGVSVLDAMMNPYFDRCRYGVFHVVNNDYVKWGMYAIGGSASPNILSLGNRFSAGQNKEVIVIRSILIVGILHVSARFLILDTSIFEQI